MELISEVFTGQHIDNVVALQAAAFCHNNPFVQALGLNYTDMYNEFLGAFNKQLYKITFIFFDKLSYEKGDREIVGTSSWCDAIDFRPPELVDYSRVPTRQLVRKYMKFMCTKQLYAKYNPQVGQMAFCTTLAVNPKYMGNNLSYKMFLQGIKWLNAQKCSYVICNCINEFSKQLMRKTKLKEIYSVDVSNMVVEEDDTKPFQGLNLSQETYLISVPESIDYLTLVIEQKENPRL